MYVNLFISIMQYMAVFHASMGKDLPSILWASQALRSCWQIRGFINVF